MNVDEVILRKLESNREKDMERVKNLRVEGLYDGAQYEPRMNGGRITKAVP